jgi:hypothetical protein
VDGEARVNVAATNAQAKKVTITDFILLQSRMEFYSVWSWS